MITKNKRTDTLYQSNLTKFQAHTGFQPSMYFSATLLFFARERREEADRGDPPVLEGPRNPLISTKAEFDRQAQTGPI